MKTTKHFALAALLILGAALSASTPVRAQSTITLTNVADPTDPDSGASGQATLSDVAYASSDTLGSSENDMWVGDFYTGYLTVSCSGLTPGARYRIGPIGFQSVFDKKTLTTTDFPTYALVRASGNGTVELAVPVIFIGGVTQYWWNRDWGGYWQFVGFWDTGYSLSVDRKEGSKYVTVLQGAFQYPY